MCGEQQPCRRTRTPGRGSPPRVRGTAPPHRFAHQAVGITPACAGNSATGAQGPAGTTDHPRVCGEQMNLAEIIWLMEGSPPRVRGTVLQLGFDEYPVGITPACAGNSPLSLQILAHSRDHPRVCGEQNSVRYWI